MKTLLRSDHPLLRRTFRPWLLLVLMVLPALFPLLQPGFFVSDDGRFHVYRLAALARAWSQGVLHPRLFPEFGFGYGQAVLNYYAPAGYWPGALLTFLGLAPATAAQWTVGLGFLLAALAAYGYIRSLWGPTAGLLAAAVYTYFPYHLADAYTRGAIPEHLAFIFPPLILWAYTEVFRRDGDSPRDLLPPLLWGTLAWSGLVLTHNLSALMMAPVALLHLLLMAAWTRRWARLAAALGSLGLAVGITAAYWLPVLAESNAVGLAAGPSRGYENHLLTPLQLLARSFFYPYRDEQGLALVYPLSWLSLGLLVLILVLFLIRRGRGQALPQAPLLAFHLAVALAAVFMTLTPSLFLWHPLTPLLGHLQYPWRFLAPAALGLMGAAAALPLLWSRLPSWLWTAVVAVLFMLVALPRLPLRPLELPAADVWSPQRMWQEDAEAGQVGATWTGEFLPVTVSEQRWALGRPRQGAADGRAWIPRSLRITRLGYDSLALHVISEEAWSLRLHQFYLPGWRARLDGRPAEVYASGELGLVTIDIPAGEHDVEVDFGSTPARRVGSILSTVSVLLWLGLVWWRSRPTRLLRATAILLLLLSLVLLLNSLGLGRRHHVPEATASRLGDVAMLVGYEAGPARDAPALDVTLYWLALRETSVDYTAFVHLLAGDGRVVGQHDGGPGGGFTPTTRWRPGEIIPDTHRIPLPQDLIAGSYSLAAGLYRFSDGSFHNLATTPPTPDNRVHLGSITLP